MHKLVQYYCLIVFISFIGITTVLVKESFEYNAIKKDIMDKQNIVVAKKLINNFNAKQEEYQKLFNNCFMENKNRKTSPKEYCRKLILEEYFGISSYPDVYKRSLLPES